MFTNWDPGITSTPCTNLSKHPGIWETNKFYKSEHGYLKFSKILRSIQNGTGSQYKFADNGVICSYFSVPVQIQAAALWINQSHWRPVTDAIIKASIVLQVDNFIWEFMTLSTTLGLWLFLDVMSDQFTCLFFNCFLIDFHRFLQSCGHCYVFLLLFIYVTAFLFCFTEVQC